jgi:3-ketosteroid 9alpha-monooxygenase subunit B
VFTAERGVAVANEPEPKETMSTIETSKGADPTAAHPDHWYHELRVARVIRETADTCSVVFEIPPDAADAFRYQAGQFLTLQVPYQGKTLARCYSLASSPDCDPEHKISIKRVEDGRISNWINDELSTGDIVKVLPPGGLFTLNDGDNDVVLFAGGSGITPCISIVKSALVKTSRRVLLVYANRDEGSIIFREELDSLVAKYGDRLQVVHSLDSRDGFLTVQAIRDRVASRKDGEFYVCGPGPFMDTVERALEVEGVDPARIHIERFVSPPDPDQLEAAAAETAKSAGVADAPAFISVFLDGKAHEVPYEKGQTVLLATQKAGLQPPFSCTDGFCGCCMAKVEAGSVKMINNDFLSQKEMDEGWVLTCQSVPTSPECSIKYPD